jgi:hypothetical protein
MVIWMLSKCVHIAGVGLVSLPREKVLAASRKLKSSWTKGSGTGQRGRMARRRRNAAAPTRVTESVFLRAMRLKLFSIDENQEEPMRGRAKATAMAMAVNAASINIGDGAVPWLGFIVLF